MSTPVPSNPQAPQSDSNQPAATLTFEETLHLFWINNSRTVYAICAVVVLAILAKGGYDQYVRWENEKVSAAYGAATSSDKLRAFASANAGHQLAGAARLRLADEAYFNGNYTQAVTDYQAAADILKDVALVGRSRLGVAMAKLQAGQVADAEAQLKLISNDASLLKVVRAEATYQLASSAYQNGKNDDAVKYLDQVNSIDPSSVWAQRAMILRMSITGATSAPVATKP